MISALAHRLRVFTLALLATTGTACARAADHDYRIPAQDLGQALRSFARQSGDPVIVAADLVAGRHNPAVAGTLSEEDALEQLLAGSGLHAERVAGAYVVRRDRDVAAVADDEVMVTGTRLRGVPSASPVLTLGRNQIIDAGQATVGEALRSVPQNFGGGQNPGVLLGAQSANPANANVTGGSAINLRGLGPDATLTLFNGHRVAYDGPSQAVDVSTIPLAALDRIEIVADGASALYGSDAVAGVANILLRKDFDGLSLNARGGAATEGGNWQQQYSAVAGTRWASGGVIATYMYARDAAIEGDQRRFTQYLTDPDTLLPAVRSHSVIVSGHQDIATGLSVAIDGTFNRRWNASFLGLPTTYSSTRNRTRAFAITPSLAWHGGGWSLGLSGNYGRDQAKTATRQYATASAAFLSGDTECYCGRLASGEATAEGPLVTLPGGIVRLAIGGGYRRNSLAQIVYESGRETDARRRSGFTYGEAFVPIVGAGMAVPLVRSLAVTGAFRYEHYDDLGGITTPKFGLLYSPVAGVDLKLSWGRSFKAPLLSQQNLPAYAYLYPIRAVGGTAYAATASALLAYGSLDNLKPERATSWTTTADIRPLAAPRVHAVASYFHVDYRDRIIQPLNITAALSSPIYAAFVTYQPTVADQQAVIARSVIGLTNFTGAPYDPAQVVAILNDYYTNVAAQTIKGVDLQADYGTVLAGGDLALTAQASWLASRQRNTPAAPSTPLAGTVFNPPHFRGRAGMIWTGGAITASSFFNLTGPVRDIRQNPAPAGGSMATIDLALRWHGALGATRPDGLELALAVHNLANERPPYLRPGTNYYVPYDSTNYSAVGRTVALSVTIQW